MSPGPLAGRLTGQVGIRTQRILYGEGTAADAVAELDHTAHVDRAHLVMLVEQKLIGAEAGGRLLRCIDELVAQRWAPVLSRPAPRGQYLAYEGYLIEQLGADVGGVLHSGRSRNDLKATITALRLREWVLDFAEQAVRLQAGLLGRARAHRSVVMPIYTHFQAAMPITYGYYLLGVALALGRDLDALRSAAGGLSTCPLGASAVAGTDLPIEPARTAELLGFARPVDHALDAVASRDAAVHLLGAAAGVAVTLSRLAVDLQLWSTVEFGFVQFPDRLVGGSSAMPQKRNAFLLEHVKAQPGHVLGAWAAATSMAAAAPFTNSIEVGTEAVAAVWPGLHAAERSVLLSQALVGGARPVPARMAERADEGLTTATALANRLVHSGVPFRTAHHLVGDAVRRAVAAGSTELATFGPPGWLDDVGVGGLTPERLVPDQRHGGGPGAFEAPFERAIGDWQANRQWLDEHRRVDAEAAAALAEAVATVSSSDGSADRVTAESPVSGGQIRHSAKREARA